MKQIGLKYISSTGKNFPAINGGKWNIASNFHGDFNRILSEAGVAPDDYDSVTFFIRYIEEGMLLCAVRRQYVRTEPGRHYENIWMFVPSDISINKEDIALAAQELGKIYDHPEALASMEGFEDILPDIFRKEFESSEDGDYIEEREQKGEREKEDLPKMKGSRVGYIPYENLAELEIILSAGYSSRYANFGLVMLTEYGVRVESSFPRIFLPELMLFQQLERQREAEEEMKEEANADGEESQDESSEEENIQEEEEKTEGDDTQEEEEKTEEEEIKEEEEKTEEEEIKEEEGRSEDMEDEPPRVVIKEIPVVPILYKRGLVISIIINLLLFIILMILI